MTEDDFISLVNPNDQELIKGVVLIVDGLRTLNQERISHLLAQVRLAKPYFPKEMLPSISSLELDFTLVLAFAEQAKKYDRSADAVRKSIELFGEIANEGPKGSG